MVSSDIYLYKVLSNLTRILSYQDRNYVSQTYGCFDYIYWRWRQKDIPNASVQYAVYPLAQIWSINNQDNPYYRNHQIKTWIEADLYFWLSIQHNNGSFDQNFPFEQSVGTTSYTLLAILHILRMTQSDLDKDLIDKMRNVGSLKKFLDI